MTLAEYRHRLLAVPMIADLPEPLRARIAMLLLWIGQPAQFPRGDSIFVEGDEDENTGAVLLAGEVEIMRHLGSPISCRAPQLLGEMLQLEPTGQRTATVHVTQEAETLMFLWHDFIAYAGLILNEDEQLVLRSVVRQIAARRRSELSGEE